MTASPTAVPGGFRMKALTTLARLYVEDLDAALPALIDHERC
ncbi:hypothetical protein [Streptomyces broussonetiae]|nr:hypothetical protein [Streptomyces broussonetiae]